MLSVTLQNLRDGALAKADMQSSGFIRPDELDAYINSSIREYYDLVCTLFEDQYTNVTPYPITATAPVQPSAQTQVALPADFYKLRAVDIQVSPGQWFTAQPYTFEQRNELQNPLIFTSINYLTLRYRLFGTDIFFFGCQNQAIIAQLWYIQLPTTLVAAGDTFDFVNGWEEYVTTDVAIKCLAKEESEVKDWEMRKAALAERIRKSAVNRDTGAADKTTDTQSTPWGPTSRF